MSFQVNWLPGAEDELAALWLESNDRKKIAEAAERIDSQLISTPLTIGESRDHGRRICFDTPLAVIYWVDAESQIVEVQRVRRSGS